MSEPTTCAISGGGPAGMVLGLLLARAGVRVTVLEKHADFLRDFRGDTVHPTTQAVLDDLGLLERFTPLVRGRISEVRFDGIDGPILRADLARVAPRARFHDIALVPQWDLLDLLATEARRYEGFTLLMSAESTGVLRRGGHVAGLRYRSDEAERSLPAVLTVAADGRGSTLHDVTGADRRELGAPMDVLWLRLPRLPGDEGGAGLRGKVGVGALAVMIDRRDYWQVAYLIRKGSYDKVRAAGIERFRDSLAALVPGGADRVAAITSWEQVAVLRVGLDRLRRWYAPGLLVVGDAAHTMSPIGGVGINLAIQDAVAAANLLTEPLLRAQDDPRRFERTLNPALLARVQRRRELPTVLTQAMQQAAQQRVIDRAIGSSRVSMPWLLRADLRQGGLVARMLARALVYGVRPETVRSPLAGN